jgi:hypothetical protein
MFSTTNVTMVVKRRSSVPTAWMFASYLVLILLMAGVAAWMLSRMAKSSLAATPPTEVRVVVVQAPAPPSKAAVVQPPENPTYPLRHVPQDFQQMGMLISQDANEDQPVMLPLFGRKMIHRDRWEYYAGTDKYHLWKIPVQQNNRMCDDDVGCNEIYDGDEVVVPDYENKVFRARIYKYAPVSRR